MLAWILRRRYYALRYSAHVTGDPIVANAADILEARLDRLLVAHD
jgi:hypothetical protein